MEGEGNKVKSKVNSKLGKLADELVEPKTAVGKTDIVGPDGKTIGYALYLITNINMQIIINSYIHRAFLFIL